ncbi:hypothetical protein DY000_02029135 [Brassica cretica]|uniref:Uncharacterized protein n=1 Tax=Brassica cretica TaxID=69181 RepID=A0ABQ7E092_BRACR|nr:hypothetical protein DY000_02029135 [Brassica cretica]
MPMAFFNSPLYVHVRSHPTLPLFASSPTLLLVVIFMDSVKLLVIVRLVVNFTTEPVNFISTAASSTRSTVISLSSASLRQYFFHSRRALSFSDVSVRDSLDEPGVIWRRLCGSEFGHEYRLGATKMWKPAKDFRLGLRRELEVETFAPYCRFVFWNTEVALQSRGGENGMEH